MPPGPGRTVFVAIPCMGELRWETALAVQAMVARHKPHVEVHYLSNVPIETARDVLVARFLKTSHPTLCFLDSDVRPPDTLLDLADLGHPITAGWYPLLTRRHELMPSLFRRGPDGKTYQPYWEDADGLVEVDAIGLGCALIRREVFAKLERPYFSFRHDPADPEQWTGEDVDFCQKAQAAGFRILAAPRMACGHLKTVDLLALWAGRDRA